VSGMTALAMSNAAVPNRRQRAAAVAAAALRGGLLGAAIAAIAWLLAIALSGTVFVLLLVATVVVILVTLVGRDVSGAMWLGLAAAWAVVLLERAVVNENGGLWVGLAAYLGVVIGARRAGISRWALPLLAYPLISVAICIAASQSLTQPWGISWLWVAAAIGPPLGVRVLLDPSPKRD
jgi:hypothetical protein